MLNFINKINFEKLILISISILIFMYITIIAAIPSLPFIKNIQLLLRIFAYSLVGIKIVSDFLYKKFTVKEFVIISLIGFYMLMISYQSKTIGYFVYFTYIIASKDVDYRKIIRFAFFTFLISSIIVLIASRFAVLPDRVFIQGSRIRHGLGFLWTTFFSNLFMYTTLYLIYYRREHLTIYEVIIVIIIACYAFIMTNTKSAFTMTIMSIVLAYILKYNSYLRQYHKFYKYIVFLFPIAMSVLIILASYFYNNDIDLYYKINRVLSGRLSIGNSVIKEYGFSLFARKITFIGGMPSDSSKYNYVDSSFLLYLLNFGIVFYIILMALIEYFAKLINDKKDTYMLLVFCIFILHSTFDPQLLSMAYNYFLMVWSYKNLRNIDNT